MVCAVLVAAILGPESSDRSHSGLTDVMIGEADGKHYYVSAGRRKTAAPEQASRNIVAKIDVVWFRRDAIPTLDTPATSEARREGVIGLDVDPLYDHFNRWKRGELAGIFGVVPRVTYPETRLLLSSQRRIPEQRIELRHVVARHAAGVGEFAAAYLLKEALQDRNPLGALKESGFWGTLLAFTGAAHLTELAVRKIPVARIALPVAAGMAFVQALSGQATWEGILVSSGAFITAGGLVSLATDGWLVGTGPLGWAIAVAKLAVTLYMGEKIESWLTGTSGHHHGVAEKIHEMHYP